MNFNQFWYGDKDKNIIGQNKYQPIDSYKRLVEFGWESCKKHVLNILDKNLVSEMSDAQVEDIFKKIENL